MIESWETRLITATYKREANERLVIEMFGKTKEGLSITLRYEGFLPYFHLVEPTDQVLAGLERDPDVIKVERIELFYRGEVRKAAQITVYTIQVNTGGDPTSTLLQNCASDPGKFFLLTSAVQIVTTFGQIGTALQNLRLSM